MATNKSRAEYEKRVNRVLDYIQEHRGEELTVETLAQVAAFSPFHFHRIFKSMTGENLMEFIQRTRLESAANQLIFRPQDEILAIAMDNGFNSPSAFARAFKERFGVTASAWRNGDGARQKSKDGQANRKDGKAAGPAAPQVESWSPGVGDEEDTMNVKVKTLPASHTAYMRHMGPYGAGGGIPQLWQKLAQWAKARDLWTADRVCLGISYDNPTVTEPAKLRYDAAIVIPQDLKVDGAVNVLDVPAGKYAIAEFAGSSTAIVAAWNQLFGGWLPQSGFQPDNRPCFELYRGEAWDGKTDAFRCDLCMPVQPL